MLKQLLTGFVYCLLYNYCSAKLFSFHDGQYANNVLPKKWSSVAECSVRYYDLGLDGEAKPTFGTPAYEREFAHMAAIGWTDENGHIEWNCGGSLITENFVLTAAHCGFWREKNPDVVRMGDLDLERSDDDQNTQQLKVVETILHPKYTSRYRYHDIALLRLNQSVRVHDTVCPACLWTNSTINFTSVEACGYGRTGLFEKRTPRLLKVTLSPVNKTACSTFYPPDRKLNVGLTDDQICAVDPEFKQDTCLGDSGGPLMIKLLGFSRINPFVIGITSFGKSCGTETPGVYVRIGSYVEWIEEVTNTSFDPLRCTAKYAEFREFEPDIVHKSEDGKFEYIDGTKQHFDVDPSDYGHRARLEPGGCGAVFVHEKYLLTAASCISRQPPKEIVAKVSRHKIAKKFIHPKFQVGQPDHDIAIVKLSTPVVFHVDNIIPACLWTKPYLPHEQLEVTGNTPSEAHSLFPPRNIEVLFNSTSYIASRANEIDPTKCKSFYAKEGIEITDNNICYGNLSWYIVPESCSLDVGGPIGRKHWGAGLKYHNFVMGIISLGTDCGYGYPAVATKVSNYIDWIDLIIFNKTVEEKFVSCETMEDAGKCVPASKCKSVVARVKKGASLNDFVCDFANPADPWVCCPEFGNVLEDCPEMYEEFRKPPVKNGELPTGHIVEISEGCNGTLVSEQHLVAPISCANSSTRVPFIVKVGGSCQPTSVQVTEVENLSEDNSLLSLKEELTLSTCIVPICVWTDKEKVPFEMNSSPYGSTFALPKNKCKNVALDEEIYEDFVCAQKNDRECQSQAGKPLYAARNESNLLIPYLVGFGTSFQKCDNRKLLYYFEPSTTFEWE